MPVVTFDAERTEWRLAHIMDHDPQIAWWLRLAVKGPAFIQTTGPNYYPDFVAVDTAGTFWLVEGKSDKEADTADAITKAHAAIEWARDIRDTGGYGDWRYLFATETVIKASGGTWDGLIRAARPE